MITYSVIAVDAGCDCCSYVTVDTFEDYQEALDCVGEDDNLIIEVDALDEDIVNNHQAIKNLLTKHEPFTEVEGGKTYIGCKHCYMMANNEYWVSYPCDTVEIIQKEYYKQ